MEGKTGVIPDVGRLDGYSPVHILKFCSCPGIFLEIIADFIEDCLGFPCHLLSHTGFAEQQVHNCAENGNDKNQNRPGELVRGIDFLIDQP